jgi:predicted short-subunit dehydrogenase-like oxidoreductase (DUF2520 family)
MSPPWYGIFGFQIVFALLNCLLMPAEPPSSFRVIMVGAGNVAWHLAPALEQAGHQVVAVWSRHPEPAVALAARLQQAVPTSSLDFRQTEAEVVLLAVADQALAGVVREARFPAGGLVAHTAGSQPLAVLQAAGERGRTGVFYPLQTFSKAKPVDFRAVPFCVEGSDQESRQRLEALARSLSDQVYGMSSAERKALHVAAVFACNFTNHLLGIGFDLLERKQIPNHLLHPLIRETMDKALAFPPFTVQTGPAFRGDGQTVAEHLRLLASTPDYQQLYHLLSESIRERTGPTEQEKQESPGENGFRS